MKRNTPSTNADAAAGEETGQSAATTTVDTDWLSRDRATVSGRIAVASLPRLAPLLSSAAGDIDYQLAGEVDDRRRPAATLRATGELTQRCDLCGRNVALPLDVHAQYCFVRDVEALDALPLEGDDEREPLVGGHRFDVAQLVEDEAILALPISPRHETCEAELVSRGAAPESGGIAAGEGESAANRGGDASGDEGGERRNPFAVLSSLKGRRTR